jgi:nicotinamide-nucleotide amidase
MKAYLLSIGDEVLNGKVVNTNAAFIGRELDKIGIEVIRTVVVGDNESAIVEELTYFQKSAAEILITTGGLGPTHDDVTREVLFGFLGLKTEKKQVSVDRLQAYFGGNFPKTNLKQTYFPENAIILENKIGTADGAMVRHNDKIYIALVGPPAELKPMLIESVIPLLKNEVKSTFYTSEFMLMGKGESAFAEDLAPLYQTYPNVKFASYPEGGQIRFEIRAKAEASEAYQNALLEFRKLMHEFIVSEDGKRIEEVVVQTLREKGYRISISESCTGGMLASLIVNVSGASEVFEEGFVTYSNEAKTKYLGVQEATLTREGAVSAAVVLEMIAGLKHLNGAEVRIAISGVAGPTGGTPEKPVGLVHYAIGIKDEEFAEAKIFKGNREQIRRKACLWVLYRLFLLLKSR